ncbi:MAG: hypothetical protein CL866_02055 [Cycloclasticus sp.]|nr:hypothetical protein [Cycloclasticus sp.]MBG95643.1 hypothetical protein [Cycloclasticus sp.]
MLFSFLFIQYLNIGVHFIAINYYEQHPNKNIKFACKQMLAGTRKELRAPYVKRYMPQAKSES